MNMITKLLAGGAFIAVLAAAAPAAAQYYPGYGMPGPGYGAPGYGAPGYGMPGYGVPSQGYGAYGYGENGQIVVNQCANAVQQRLGGGAGYGYGGGYGGNYGGGRVLGISHVEPRADGGLLVRGVASSGRAGAYGYGYNAQAPVDLTWRCRTDFRGLVVDVDIRPAQPAYGGGYGYTPYSNSSNSSNYNDYSQYGYVRY
jgi:hypothetical protein